MKKPRAKRPSRAEIDAAFQLVMQQLTRRVDLRDTVTGTEQWWKGTLEGYFWSEDSGRLRQARATLRRFREGHYPAPPREG